MIVATLTASATLVVWCLLSGRMTRWGISAPLVMVLAGAIVGIGAHGVVSAALNTTAAQRAAEVILAILLFVEATEVRGSLLGRYPRLASRSLLIGIPVGLILSVLLGWLLLPQLSWPVLLLIACVVAPIDFASAPSLLRNRYVPDRVRDVLTVESGYTDGLVTPLFVFALFWADPEHGADDPARALLAAAPQAAIALAVGVVTGFVFALAMKASERAELSSLNARRLAVVAVPLVVYTLVVGLNGNGFVAAFVCGIIYRLRRGPAAADDVRLSEDVGFLLTGTMWFVFGSTAVFALFGGYDWRVPVYVIAALTVVRIIPAAVAMTGAGLPRRQVLALGWLRPRGTSTIVFALIAYNTLPDGPVAELALTIAVLVVLGSVALHTVGVPMAIAGHDRRERHRV
ncbi:cation:proton antiporter [Tsukamurella serpentis]